jgi:pimeloyl-ACP methyl ester carboxylesterase
VSYAGLASIVPQRREFELAGERGALSALVWNAAGTDAPLLIFLHANGFNGNAYRGLLGRLEANATIVAPDMRGHGRTTLEADWRRLHTWHVYRDDLNALRDALGRKRPLVLAGHSLGAATALLSALDAPRGIAGIFLIEPVIIPSIVRIYMTLARRLGLRTPTTGLSEAARRRRTSWPDRATVLEAYKKRGVFRSWADEAIADYIDGGTRAAADGTLELACHPEWEAATYRAQGHDLWSRLETLDCPVYLLTGSINSTCPPALTHRLKSRLRHVEMQRVTGAGHFLPMERPELVAAELRRFLDRVA